MSAGQMADMNRTVRIRKRTGHERSVEFLGHMIGFYLLNLQIYKNLQQFTISRLYAAEFIVQHRTDLVERIDFSQKRYLVIG